MNEEDGAGENAELSTNNSSFSINIPVRTFEFAIRVVRLCQFLEKQGKVSQTLANQLLRSGTSIGANTER